MIRKIVTDLLYFDTQLISDYKFQGADTVLCMLLYVCILSCCTYVHIYFVLMYTLFIIAEMITVISNKLFSEV